MARVGELTVDLSVLVRNWRKLSTHVNVKPIASHCEVSAVVKADAYGLGVVPVSRALYEGGCRTFFVANIAEALELSRALPEDRVIYTLQGFEGGQEGDFVQHNIRPVIISMSMLELWLEFESVSDIPCAIKVNTGMNRLGLDEKQFLDVFLERPQDRAKLNVSLVLSHLACADDPDNHMNRSQLGRFKRIVDQCRELKCFELTRFSLANSAACFLGDEYLFDMVRAGIAIYSGALGNTPVWGEIDLSCPISLMLPIIHRRLVRSGECVGYGGAHKVAQDTCIATVGGGYSDGLFRFMAGKATVSFGGGLVRVVGRVSMDSFAIDLGTANLIRDDLAEEGSLADSEYVSIFHSTDSLIALAKACNTISYELLTSLGSRYKRRYLHAVDDGFLGENSNDREASLVLSGLGSVSD